jgi:uncharacterized membrane protein
MGKQAQVAPKGIAGDLRLHDLANALTAGWRDFRAYPLFGLLFSSLCVLGGMAIYLALSRHGEAALLIPAAAGFPIVLPFVAVGLYEVSRRREAGMEIGWRSVLAALRGRGDEQILCMGVIVFVAFGFWLMIAHAVFTVFLATSGIGSESLDLLFTLSGQLMLLVGSAIGALIAWALYSITIISLPMLVDRDVDFITAIIASLATVRANTLVLLAWGLVIVGALFVAMVPFFLGLLVALPVLGHATWHLYRRVLGPPES